MRQRMQRTQFYLEPELGAALDNLARVRGTSPASLIRLAARRLLQEEQAAGDDPILGLINLGDAGPGQVSVEHDRYVSERRLRQRVP
jgi:hypothetical protein